MSRRERWRRRSVTAQSPPPTTASVAVLFYATDDDRAGQEVERLIRTAGFEPVKVGGLDELVVTPAQARSLITGA
jgi:predicted dinucleotide-binding enzyme